jgi:hypothetical protein
MSDRRKYAQNFTMFGPDIADPEELTFNSYIVPANARLGVSANVPITEGQVRLYIGSSTYRLPTMPANQIFRLNYTEAGKNVLIDKDIDAVISLYVFNQWMEPFLIGTLDVDPYLPVDQLGSKLKAYWDMTDAINGSGNVTKDGSNLISAWKDRIANLTIPFVGSAQPLFSTSYLNGRASAVFDGTTDYGRLVGITGLPVGSAPRQVWILFETIGAGQNGTMFNYGGTANDTYVRIGRSAGERLTLTTGTTGNTASGLSGATNGRHMAMGRWSATEDSGRIRGGINPTSLVMGVALNTSTTQLTVGATNATTPAQFFSGAISAILITDDTLTIDEQQKLESWGYREAGSLVNLPDDHPYREGPDKTTSFTSIASANIISSAPMSKPFLVDFRTAMPDQIKTRCASQHWKYDISGSKVLVPANTPSSFDYDPVTHEPLGLASFSGSSILNADRTLATPQVFVFSATGLAPTSLVTWYDTNATMAVYALGSGQVRLQFDQAVEVLNADGTSPGDIGLPITTTTDININCVGENTVGWYNGVNYFKMPRSPNPNTTVTMSKVGGATIVHAEACRGTAAPPTVTGITRTVPVMESTFDFTGLPRNLTSFTFCQLVKVSHVMQGGQYMTFDDNDLSKPITPTATQPVNRVALNYLSNPRYEDSGRKSGFMGVSYCTEDDPGDELGESGGIDPQDVVMEKMKWRCFFGTGNWLTGDLAVCCNGGAVERAVFPLDRFPSNLRKIRWMGSYNGGLCPDGWLAGMYLEQADYTVASDATIKAMCDPASSLFGTFNPN